MVQKDTRRRSSLILGVLLALLLGVAAGFLVLAVPIRMLETVTTFTRLSSLMVQAEPPISPSDRTLLAVLAGIFIAGIGWVLVDWLLFGRAGMSTIIKPREDEYEDEDGDNFRPTDPLDLVSPVSLPVQEWNPAPSGDARRPLSARTDIGEPASPFGAPAMPPSGGEASPNPFGQILPGVGTSAPPLQSVIPQPSQPFGALVPPPLVPQLSGGIWGTHDPAASAGPLHGAQPPLDLSTTAPAALDALSTDMRTAAPSMRGGWLPTPGVRPDSGQSRFESDDWTVNDIAQPGTQSVAPPSRTVPPVLTPQPTVATASEPQPAPATTAQPFFAPPAEPLSPGPVAASSLPPLPEPGFDKVRLEELLVRLERGLQNRRAVAAAAATAAAAAPLPPAPEPAIAQPVAPRVEPPAAYAARMPEVPQPMPIYAEPPVESAPIFSIAPAVPQPATPAPTVQPDPASAPVAPAQAAESAARNDEMLDQPLHVTLELLRNMVKR
ncbi:hypothetical protein [Sphingomonas sp. SRS2]|uniref:hypothetical protein n=1 Tax=Sphingomonas sp. SRS2 TaxID=133190 RepID=UPI0006184838|nr:hypothetical protein [Sphingomonas sp. SRS2]KKC27411.1 hypothetical protein WP12_03225 [Sphingomonas sp. SRS2]